MQQHSPGDAARNLAVACARRIFYRPNAIVEALVASFRALPDEQYPGRAAIAQECYERPIRMGATLAVFGLRALHWPMLNLLDEADRDRRRGHGSPARKAALTSCMTHRCFAEAPPGWRRSTSRPSCWNCRSCTSSPLRAVLKASPAASSCAWLGTE